MSKVTIFLFSVSIVTFILGQLTWFADRHMHDPITAEQAEANRKFIAEHPELFQGMIK
jgi:hypothetical protein